MKEVYLNGKMKQLTAEEEKANNEFHQQRQIFCIAGGSIYFADPFTTEDHFEWMSRTMGMDKDEYETTIRGYIMKDRIQFFIGTAHSAVPDILSRITIKEIDILAKKYAQVFRDEIDTDTSIKICNGVSIGEIGKQWDELETIGHVRYVSYPDIFYVFDFCVV